MVFGAMQSARLTDFLSLITFYNECPILLSEKEK